MILTAAAAAVGGFLFEKFADKAIDEGGKGLWKRITDKSARQALAVACAVAIEAAAAKAPALAEDLRSQSFCDGVIVPLVRGLLERSSALIDAETLASEYVAMFVERFAAGEGSDATLIRLFQTDRAQLVSAFEAFLAKLKDELYATEHWREAQHYHTAEVTSSQVGRILTLLEEDREDARARLVDVDRALAEAAVASAEMRAWPSDIHGLRLETPALGRLLARIRDEPAGRTLLVGEAGSGKSALLAHLAPALENQGVIVFAIKADQLPASLASLADLARALGVDEGLEDRIAALAAERPVALLLDQLDAVSDIMDRQSHRMQLLLQLIHRLGARARAGDKPLSIHVVVSSRPFEAAHDARFQQLRAELLQLDLLAEDQVAAMLAHLQVSGDKVDAALRRTLRRPFALKLYADIVIRSGDADGLTPASLLDAWLATANLGVGAERRETSDFLLALAEEMVATETLWRPADAFDLGHGAAVRRAAAAGLVVRSGDKLGFSHQSWLDDFQAKTFCTGRDLAEYAWDRQDSLFIRASVLRGLERLRVRAERSYGAALETLLMSRRTRRHLLHLIADIIATAADPLLFEIAWVAHWIHNDAPLASRAIRQIGPRWERWRDGLRGELPTLMTNEVFHWHAARLLAEEVRIDAAHVARLIDRYWDDPARDRLVFQILELADFVGLEVKGRLRTIFGRTPIEDHSISHMVRTLRAEQRFEDAAAVTVIWLEAQNPERSDHPSIYELERLADAAPLTLARELLPWFIRIATQDVRAEHTTFAQYPRSNSLPYSWHQRLEQGSPFEALHRSLALLGKQDPSALWDLLAPYAPTEIDEVQELIAVGLAAAGQALAQDAFAYLLADTRRLQISHIIAARDGMITSVDGWHSHQLVRAIMPGLNDTQLATLRDMIEGWSCYTEEAVGTDDPDLVARRLLWCDQARFPLLEALPARLLKPARLDAIAQWRAENPALDPAEDDVMGGWVGPPVTHDEMAGISDDELLAQLDEFHDDSGEHRWDRPISRSGGVRELARAFAEFGKANPQRAFVLAKRLASERHQRAAGDLVREIAGEEGIDQQAVLNLILDFDRRGFASEEFRHDAAGALQKLAIGSKGLGDDIVTMLESWIQIDHEAIAAQVKRRREFEAQNRQSWSEADGREPMLFGHGFGMQVLPQDNFTILSAISNALLCRKEPDCQAWTNVLERHLAFPEDPAIWTGILLWRGDYLRFADAEQVTRIFDRLWDKFPEAWLDVRLLRFWWQLRARISDDVKIKGMANWIVAGGERERQAAGELLAAAHLVDPGSELYRLLFKQLDRSDASTETGVMFSASAAWRDSDPAIRTAAHELVMAALPTAEGMPASALACAVNRRSTFSHDARTKEFLTALIGNEAVFRKALEHRFSNALQDLLLHPGFDEIVLAIVEKAAELITDGGPRWGVGEELVRVAIALQRSDGATRSRAMDVYERLLDAAIYGAEEAAQASLSR
jgi:energy-coupling factor transporter ATP-binding protein EcfA2